MSAPASSRGPDPYRDLRADFEGDTWARAPEGEPPVPVCPDCGHPTTIHLARGAGGCQRCDPICHCPRRRKGFGMNATRELIPRRARDATQEPGPLDDAPGRGNPPGR